LGVHSENIMGEQRKPIKTKNNTSEAMHYGLKA